MDSIQNMHPPRKMWCHLCKWEFETLQNPTESKCSKCNNDFVEEIDPSQDPRTFVPFGEDNVQQPAQQQQLQQPQQPQFPLNLFPQSNSQNQTQTWSGRTQLNNGTTPLSYSISIQTLNGNNNSMNGPNNGGLLSFNSILANLFPNTAQRAGMTGINDQTGFDNILDFLLRNDTNVYGSPPAAETAINELARIKYANSDTGNMHECTVCKEDLVIDEEVIKMPCNHLFHPDCLLTWLKAHNSCPTCRHELPTNNEDYERRKIQNQQNQQNNNNSRRM